MHLDYPVALLLLIFTPLFLESGKLKSWLLPKKMQASLSDKNVVLFSSPVKLSGLPTSFRSKYRAPFLSTLRVTSFVLLVIALARPQTGTSYVEIDAQGRDIMLTLDTSGSMKAVDFFIDEQRVTRLEALKKVTRDFIAARKGDRIGMVVFGENAFTQSPLTLDHHTLLKFVDNLEIGMAGERTTIGDALAVSLKRMKNIPAESKAIVLVTDGKSNMDSLQPLEAAQVAKELNTKIYTIGIGGEGPAPFMVDTVFGMQRMVHQQLEFDEKTLKQIAEITGGQYFAAKDTESLNKIFSEIDKLEERQEKTFEHIEYEEQFLTFLVIASILLLLTELATSTLLFKVP